MADATTFDPTGADDHAPPPRGGMDPRARRLLRVLGWIGIALLGLVALVLVAVWVATNTDWGRERVRRFAENTLNGIAHGTVRIGRLDGNLLEGVVASGFSITDSAGAPLVTADTLATRFDLAALLGQRIVLSDTRLVNPLVVLDQRPGEGWNFARIFPSDTTAVDTSTAPGWGDWLRVEDLRIRDGRVIVRLPWEPDAALAGAARDSAVAAALDSTSRANVVAVEGGAGWQTVYDFRRLTAHLPLLRIADPAEDHRLFEVASLTSEAYPFRPPAAMIADLRGDFRIAEDSLWFTVPSLRLPGSQLAAQGIVRFGDGSSVYAAQARPVALADLQFAYPALPDSGAGTLDVQATFNGDTAVYVARGVDLRVERATLAGDLGLVLFGDTLAFRQTDLRFAGVETGLIERLAPGVEIPRTGVLGGRAALDGSLAALTVDGDVTFDDAVAGRNRVTARGLVGVAGGEVAAEDLRVTIDPLQVALVRAFAPDLPIGGVITGQAVVNGSSAGTLLVAGLDVTHRDGGERSRITGRAGIRRSPSLYLDVDAALQPLSLATVGRFAPAIGLRGSAAGPVRARGTLGALDVDAGLRFPDGGQLALDGRLDLEGEIGYDVRTRLALFDASTVVATAPRTSVTATASARGAGTDPATLRTEIAADLQATSVDTIAVDSASVRVRAANGLATIDTVAVYGPATLVAASGTLGLREGVDGEIAYLAQVDSLAAFAHFIGVTDTTEVAPRPGITARALARARADSARIAEATMVERMATGRAQPTLAAVEEPEGIPADSVAGAIYTRGFARGSIRRLSVSGAAGATGVVARGSAVGDARVLYEWVNGLTPEASIVVAARADSVRAAGFALDSVDVRGTYQGERGFVDVVINQQDDIDYRARANFRLALDESELTLQETAVRFDTTTWRSAQAGAVRWGARGVFVDSLDLRAPGERQIFVHGLIPSEGEANVEARITGFQVGDALALLQSDVPVRGQLSLNARLTGPATAPQLTGAVGFTDGTYGEAPMPNVRATLGYADETLTTQAELLRPIGGERLALAVGELPVNLALQTEAPRLPDRQLRFDLDADSLPLGLVPQFTDALADVDGDAFGAVRVRGTLKDPQIAGAITLLNGRATIVPLGVPLRDVSARIRMAGDSVVVDSLVGYNPGRVFVRGGLGIADPAAPSFDLYLVANDALVLNNEMGRVFADAGIAARGPFDGVYVSGAARVTQGVINIPATDGKNVIAADDPAVFAVVDTAVVDPALVPETSPLVANLRANVALAINRDTWVRSSEANVEIFTPDDPGPLEIAVDQRAGELGLRGVVSTDRGEYRFLNKRFQVASGTVNFIGGTTEINPLLQITANYEVQQPAQEAMLIRIIIGGTLQNPQLSLESDAQPPVPQSDLISLLALGRSSSSLLQFNQGSSLTSGGATRGAVGAGAALAGQRLAAMAVGVAVDQLEGDAARALGADVINITPAEIAIEAANPLGGFDALVRGTEIEAGRYVNRRTFVSLTARPALLAPTGSERAIPGVRVQHRIGEQLRLEANYEGRFRVRPPTLEEESRVVSTGVFGFFVIREWGW